MLSTLKLIRLPNLGIIALTLYSFRYLVIKPYYGMSGMNFQMDSVSFAMMVAITMLIAATGYIINDFFDTEIDKINKPDKTDPDKNPDNGVYYSIAFLLSFVSLICIAILSIRVDSVIPIFVLVTALVTVWLYAGKLKKTFVWGNLAVALMSSLTIGMAWLFEWMLLNKAQVRLFEIKPITQITIGITVFAFLLSLVREIVKDLEDMEGDKVYGCKSIPLTRGIPFTKSLVNGLSVLTLILLSFCQFRLQKMDFPMVVLWLIPAVEIPLLYFIFRMFKATDKKAFHKLSILLKWIMVGGIGSMAVIWLNFRF